MDQATHNRIVSFIWGIADDVLRDLFKRGKYPDVILPMCVVRRFDAVLEPTKKAVLEGKKKGSEPSIDTAVRRVEIVESLCSRTEPQGGGRPSFANQPSREASIFAKAPT